MFTPAGPQVVPFDASPAQGRWMRRTAAQLEAMSRFQGVSIAGGTMPTENLHQNQWIFGKIRNEDSEGSGSGSGTGQFSVSPVGAGFTDEEGYLAYAFDQIYDDYPWKGTLVNGGIRTTLPHSGVSGANYAYPLNQDLFETGSNVILKRAGFHWVIVGALGDAVGSGSGAGIHTWHFNCDTGLLTQLR